EIKRVGGTDSFGVDVRVIAATNRDLGALIAGGRFREDLFYRLSVVTLQVPPLGERREDIPILAAHFLRMYAAANARPVSDITPEAMALLVAYEWPGNIRELEHAIERAVALTTSSVVRPEDLPPKCVGTVAAADAAGSALSLRGVVTRHVRRVLGEARWNKKLAPQLLGGPRRCSWRRTRRRGSSVRGRGRTRGGGPAREAPANGCRPRRRR